MKNRELPQFTNSRDVIKYEFKNYSHIILWRTKDRNGGRSNFWHTTMNSALMMRHLVKSKAALHSVRDYYFQNMLRCYLCYTDKHIPAISKALCDLKSKAVRVDDSFLVFELAEPVDEKQMREWKKESEVEEVRLEEMYRPNRNPDFLPLYDLLRNLGGEIQVMNRRMAAADRETFGYSMVECLRRAYTEYHHFAAGKSVEDIAKRRVFVDMIDEISFLNDICSTQKLIDGKKALRMGQIFADIRECLRQEELGAQKK